MQHLENFGDQRQLGWCVYCGGDGDTRDHVPSKVFMDEPYPANLPVVASCQGCNSGFSLDEEYLACVIECVLAGSSDPEAVERQKIRRALVRKPALATRIVEGLMQGEDSPVFRVDPSRVRNVILKLARGHAAFKLNEPQLDEPVSVSFLPLPLLSAEALEAFEVPPRGAMLPEVGSRALQRLFFGTGLAANCWVKVQEGRYRFLAVQSPGVVVRIVLSEYLVGEVIWA